MLKLFAINLKLRRMCFNLFVSAEETEKIEQ